MEPEGNVEIRPDLGISPPTHGLRIVRIIGTVLIRVMAAVLQAITLVILARLTTVSDFGSYSSVFSLGLVIGSFTGFGFPVKALRLHAEDASHLAPTMVIILLLTASIGAGVAIAFAGATTGWSPLTLAAGAAVVCDSVTLLAQNLLFGEERTNRAQITLLIARVWPLLSLGIAHLGKIPVGPALTTAYILSILTSILMLGSRAWREFYVREAVSGSAHYWRGSNWATLQQVDIPIVGAVLGAVPAGAYAAGFRLASPVHIVTTSLNSLYVPQLSKTADRLVREREGKKLVRLGMAYAALLILLSPATIFLGPFLLGQQYSAQRVLFPIFFINSAVSVVNQLQASRLYADGRAKVVASGNRFSTLSGLAMLAVGCLIGNLTVCALSTVLIQLLLSSSYAKSLHSKPDISADGMPGGAN